MLALSPTQMEQLETTQRTRNLHRIADHFALHDPALARGRLGDALLPIVEKAAAVAATLELKSTGAVAVITSVLLAIEGDPASREALGSVIDVLRDARKSEADRLERANRLLFDLEESLPQTLRNNVAISATPELDV